MNASTHEFEDGGGKRETEQFTSELTGQGTYSPFLGPTGGAGNLGVWTLPLQPLTSGGGGGR